MPNEMIENICLPIIYTVPMHSILQKTIQLQHVNFSRKTRYEKPILNEQQMEALHLSTIREVTSQNRKN